MINLIELKQKPLFQLTTDEFLTILKSEYPKATTEIPISKKYAYGIKGLSDIFGCSIPTASRIKASGKIDRAIKQIGRKIIVDAELALELAGKKEGGRR